MDWLTLLSNIGVALIAFLGVYISNRKTAILMEYRLEQLEAKVEKHNNIVERTYRLEGRMDEAEHDIRDLKGAIKVS